MPSAEQRMNVNNPNLASPGAAGTPRTERSAPAPGNPTAVPSSTPDDAHLSELVRSLRSLAADSPERQNKIEQLTRSCANGSYNVDAQATAEAIINEATKR